MRPKHSLGAGADLHVFESMEALVMRRPVETLSSDSAIAEGFAEAVAGPLYMGLHLTRDSRRRCTAICGLRHQIPS
jgi:hypothetical protein